MKGNILEAIVGAVVLIIAGFFVYFAFESRGDKLNDGYVLFAEFDNVGSLAVGADVKVSGLKVGIVKSLKIGKYYRVSAELFIKQGVVVPTDTVAAVVTDGLMGNKFVDLKIGLEDTMMKPGQKIGSTISAVNLEDIINKLIAGFISKGS